MFNAMNAFPLFKAHKEFVELFFHLLPSREEKLVLTLAFLPFLDSNEFITFGPELIKLVL